MPLEPVFGTVGFGILGGVSLLGVCASKAFELKKQVNVSMPFRYGSGDTRYMRQHSSSHATETMLVLSGPFELAAVAMFKAWLLGLMFTL